MTRPAARLTAALAGATAILGLALSATATGSSAAPTAPTASASSASNSASASIRWIDDDMRAAMTAAARNDKYILINFTGSDWCGWCIKLENEVFDKPEFEPASKDLVFAKLDFPRQSRQRAEVKEANKAWQSRLEVRGFPTIFLADAQGRPFAKTGYKAGGPDAYMKHLAPFISKKRAQDALVAKAEKAEGVERAKLLGEALEVTGILTPTKDLMIIEIKNADPDDTLGLLKKYGVPAGTPLSRALAAIRTMAADGDLDGAISGLRQAKREFRPKGAELADWALARMDVMVAIERPRAALTQADVITRRSDVPVSSKQELMRAKAGIELAMGNGDAAIKTWDKAIAADATTEIGKAMQAQRDDFAARCRNAG